MTSILSGVAAVLLAAGWMNAYANTGDDDGSSLKLTLTPTHRYFVRFGAGWVAPKDSASAAKDLSGPVVPYQSLTNIANKGAGIGAPVGYQFPGSTTFPPGTLFSSDNYDAWLGAISLKSAIDGDKAAGDYTNAQGIGLPPGVSQKAVGGAGTAFLSLGMYLDDDKKWSAETFILGLPVKLQAKGMGSIAPHVITYKDNANVVHQYNFNLGTIGSTKLLPLTFIFNYSFFDKDAKFRPTLGAMLTYNIFFESKLSQSFSDFAGGPSKIKLKNAPGIGPIFGFDYRLDDRWSINARIGYQISKTTGTVTTETYASTIANSPVILLGEGKTLGPAQQAFFQNPAYPIPLPLFRAVAYQNTGDPNANYLGTFSRSFRYSTNALVFLVSLGYDF